MLDSSSAALRARRCHWLEHVATASGAASAAELEQQRAITRKERSPASLGALGVLHLLLCLLLWEAVQLWQLLSLISERHACGALLRHHA